MSEQSDKPAPKAKAKEAEESPGAGPHVVPSRSGITTPEDETHQVSDLISAAPAVFGCPAEELAGAAAHAGWEMTAQVSAADARVALEQYRELPV